MKNLLIIMLCALSYVSTGQTIAQNGVSTYTATALHTVNYKGTAITANKDTLTNTDTGCLYVWVGQGYDASVEFTVTTLTGTVTPVAIHLYGINNGGHALTAAQVAADFTTPPANMLEITGIVTSCAGCVGAGSTTVPGAAKTYKWIIPKSAAVGASFDNLIARIIVGGTATSTYGGFLTTER